MALNDLATHRWVKNFLATKKATRGGLASEIVQDGVEMYEGELAVEIIRFGTKAEGAQIVPGMGPFESHHIIPKYIQKKLQKCLNKIGQWNLDDVPAVLETRPDHWFPEGLHSFISGNGLHWNQMSGFTDDANSATTILNKLVEAYENAGRADLADVVRAWRLTVE